ncbi:DUF6359 domain-containing protein [Paenisporosarcina cavernae]|uniref:Endonuclease n=1 Tax=Paenisporosarcina cavernae TaxID=2320858 RepID=A0A385YS94_9BACL|nr:DUF6359 domain-containing protein [Paenisporosarcina cavernae]AYC28857.1 endonuclease [Paenisporosarcina cavernae]
MTIQGQLVGRKGFIVFAVLLLVLSMALPFQANAEGELTVAEAIANNDGTATVQGYIVGQVTSTNNVKQDGNYTADTNVAIADDASETDTTKMLYVQLPSSFRAQFGLQSNPDNIGKKITVTGSLEAYYTHPGLKSPTAMTFADGSGGGEPPFEPIDPATVREIGIHDIQGEGHISPYANKTVTGVVGVVSFVEDDRNVFIQDLFPDNNAKTSEAALLYKPAHNLRVGDVVLVEGTVKEWVLEGYSDKLQTDLSMTEINAQYGKVTKINTAEVPAPVIIGEDGLMPPTKVIDNDNFGEFDPQEDGIDFYEALEGMLVGIDSPQIVSPQKYGEVFVVPNGTDTFFNEKGAINIFEDDFNPERITVETSSNFVSKAGDRFEGMVVGAVSYGFGNYQIHTGGNVPAVIDGGATRDVTDLVKDDAKLSVASYNVENFSANEKNTSDEKVALIAESFVHNLHSPDIVSLVEVQDNNGPTDDGTVDATESYERLVAAIEAAGGPSYAFTDIAPEDKEDGGQPGGNIRVGFLYNPERVSLAEGVKGTATEAVAFENGSLTLNPGRIEPANFPNTRKSLAAEFLFQGEKVVVIANHLNSKSGDQSLFGKTQPPFLGSEAERIELATMIQNFIASGIEQDEGLNVIVAGDMNDYEFTPALAALKGNTLTNMVEKAPLEDRFSYVYQGNAQVLDHILVSNNLADRTEIDMVHMNSTFMEEHGRASDHDPVLIQTLLTKPADGIVEEDEMDIEITQDDITISIPEEELFEETRVELSETTFANFVDSGKDVIVDYGAFEATFDSSQLAKIDAAVDGDITFTLDQTADEHYDKGKALVDPFAFSVEDEAGEDVSINWTKPVSFVYEFEEAIDAKHVKTFYLDERGNWKNAPVTSKNVRWTFQVKNTEAMTIVKTK